MSILVQNMPLVFLVVIALGIICIIYSVIKIVSDKTNNKDNYTESTNENTEEIKELFSYFLEEESKKNQDMRELLKHSADKSNTNSLNTSEKTYSEIMEYYLEGKSEEWIAKKLKKGIGEVKLIISLYNMK